jgi:hypothetical protein
VGLHAERAAAFLDVRVTRETATGIDRARTTLACIVVGFAIRSVPLEVKFLLVLLLLYLDIALLQLEHMAIFGLDVLVGLSPMNILFIFMIGLFSLLHPLAVVFQFLRSHLVRERVLVLALVVRLVPRVRQVSYVRLQLLEENETQGYNGLIAYFAHVLSLLDRIDVEEHVRLLLQKVWVLLHKALNELCYQQNCAAILELDILHFFK